MPYYKKISPKISAFLLAWVLFVPLLAFAAPNNIAIKSADLFAYEEGYFLNADAQINFSKTLETVIQKGFTLKFLLEFQLVVPQKYWFDDEIATTRQEITLSYHALTRQYLVARGDQQRAFASLDEAVEDLSVIQDVRVLGQRDVVKGEHYLARLQMRLDYKKLPKALRIEPIDSEEWHIVSPLYEWSPKVLKGAP